MLGEKGMKPEFKPLAEWIDKTYEVKTINIIYDTFDKGTRPRLEICFEHPQEKSKFTGANRVNFDTVKQHAIGQKFKETLIEQGLIQKNRFIDLFKKPANSNYKTDSIWVIYSDFETIAKMEASGSIPESTVEALKNELANKDIWGISRPGPIFFLYTDDQVKKYENSEESERWTDKYFDLLSKYDQFGYIKRDFFSIYLDSKENFDTNYESNWFYYFR